MLRCTCERVQRAGIESVADIAASVVMGNEYVESFDRHGTAILRCLGCWHFNTSRPFTISGHTYEVCLDCGEEFPYSLRTMSFTADTVTRQALTGRSLLVPSNLDS